MVGTTDPKFVIGEVAARHGIKIDANDPMMAVVTMNELAMVQAITPVIDRIEAVGPAFEEVILKVHRRAGRLLSDEVSQAAAIVRAEIQRDIEKARLDASQLILDVQQANKQTLRLVWFVMSLIFAMVVILAVRSMVRSL